jgi:hypothetical protein
MGLTPGAPYGDVITDQARFSNRARPGGAPDVSKTIALVDIGRAIGICDSHVIIDVSGAKGIYGANVAKVVL